MVDGRKIVKAKIKKTWKNVVVKMFNDYISQTSIHGFRYLIEGKRINGVFWFIALVFSVVGCVCLIKQTYSKWNESPVIVSFAPKSTPLWTLPWPAITICPEIKYKKSLFNLTSHLKAQEITNPIMKNYQNALFPICPRSYPSASNVDLDFAGTLRTLAIPHHEVFALNDWIGRPAENVGSFFEILTDEGICYTFNMLNYNDLVSDVIDDSMKYPRHGMNTTLWTFEDGYSIYTMKVYPTRALGSGLKAGMELRLLAKKKDLDFKCKGPVQGFKLALHSPTDWPRLTKQFYRIPLEKEILINVLPKVIETADNLRKYDPHVRQCYFAGEKKLRFFKIYTEPNCKLECLSNFTVKTCGCTKFGFPHDNVTKVCNYIQQECAEKSEMEWIIAEWNSKSQIKLEKNSNYEDCKCLPSCKSIAYEAELSYGDYFHDKFVKELGFQFDNDWYLSSLVKIYFKDDQFITLTRSELFGVVDFLSNCGGLLGLFMGISILSMVEFVYYFSLRWFCALKEEPETIEESVRRVSNAVLAVEGISLKDDDDKSENMIMDKEPAVLPTVSGSITYKSTLNRTGYWNEIK